MHCYQVQLLLSLRMQALKKAPFRHHHCLSHIRHASFLSIHYLQNALLLDHYKMWLSLPIRWIKIVSHLYLEFYFQFTEQFFQKIFFIYHSILWVFSSCHLHCSMIMQQSNLSFHWTVFSFFSMLLAQDLLSVISSYSWDFAKRD